MALRGEVVVAAFDVGDDERVVTGEDVALDEGSVEEDRGCCDPDLLVHFEHPCQATERLGAHGCVGVEKGNDVGLGELEGEFVADEVCQAMVVRRETLVGVVADEVNVRESIDRIEGVVGGGIVNDHHVDLAGPLRRECCSNCAFEKISAVVVDQYDPQPGVRTNHLPNRRFPASRPR